MTQAIEILEKHRLFLIEVEREADVQDAIKAIVIIAKQQAEEIQRLSKAIEAAPHGQWCRAKGIQKQYDAGYCDCWKRDALESQ